MPSKHRRDGIAIAEVAPGVASDTKWWRRGMPKTTIDNHDSTLVSIVHAKCIYWGSPNTQVLKITWMRSTSHAVAGALLSTDHTEPYDPESPTSLKSGFTLCGPLQLHRKSLPLTDLPSEVDTNNRTPRRRAGKCCKPLCEKFRKKTEREQFEALPSKLAPGHRIHRWAPT